MNRYWNFITVAYCPHDAAHGELGEANLGLVSVQPKSTRRTAGGLGDTGSPGGEAREEWERTFAINWWGVYFCARTFLPLLIASGDGVLVNTSSVAGFWPTAGAGAPPRCRLNARSSGLARKPPTRPGHPA